MEEIKEAKNFIWWIIGVCIVISIIGFVMTRAIRTTDKAFIRYEEYQEIYNTCVKLNTDLCRMKELPEEDKMFEQFSKAQRVIAIQTGLNRWIEEYNAKSKMWNRALWKSDALPYQLSVEQFSCY
jgi:hypothetical protein